MKALTLLLAGLPCALACDRPTTAPDFSAGARRTPSASQSIGDTWASKTRIPTSRYQLAAAGLGGLVYVLGGTRTGGSFNTNEAYDPSTDSWATLAPLPTPRRYLSAAVAGGKLYAIGGFRGWSFVGANEAYDPLTNTWTSLTPMPTPRIKAAAASVEGKVYVIGGSPSSSGSEIWQSDVNEEYDPATDLWTRKAPMPTARSYLAAVEIGGKIYVVGGYSWALGRSLATTEIYDPSTDSWTTGAAMPTARADLGAASVGDRLYALGGDGTDKNEEYDPASDTWSIRTPMLAPHGEFAAAAAGGRIYAESGSAENENDEYTPVACSGAPTVAVSATPTVIWPPDHRQVSIAVSGKISELAGCSTKSVTLRLDDSQGPGASEAIALAADGSFNAQLRVTAWRDDEILAGRAYTFTVDAANDSGHGEGVAVVRVPHDQRK